MRTPRFSFHLVAPLLHVPAAAAASKVAWSPTTILMLNGSARDCRHAIVCGWVSRSTKKVCLAWLLWEYDIIIASAAAVPSSRRDALAMSMPVKSVTIV